MKLTLTEFKEHLSLSPMPIRDCSFCGYEMKFLMVGNRVCIDSGCYCVTYCPKITPQPDEAIEAMIEAHGSNYYHFLVHFGLAVKVESDPSLKPRQWQIRDNRSGEVLYDSSQNS